MNENYQWFKYKQEQRSQSKEVCEREPNPTYPGVRGKENMVTEHMRLQCAHKNEGHLHVWAGDETRCSNVMICLRDRTLYEVRHLVKSISSESNVKIKVMETTVNST